jgi:hypothetical protein
MEPTLADMLKDKANEFNNNQCEIIYNDIQKHLLNVAEKGIKKEILFIGKFDYIGRECNTNYIRRYQYSTAKLSLFCKDKIVNRCDKIIKIHKDFNLKDNIHNIINKLKNQQLKVLYHNVYKYEYEVKKIYKFIRN